MIPYVEIRDKYTLDTVALVEPQECWFELSFYEVGEFEIFCRASKANLNALQKGRYVTLPNKRFIWVITAVRYTFTAGGSRMISATGYEAKWLLSKRCILTPKELTGHIGKAVYGLVNHALGTGANAARTISDNNGKHKFFMSNAAPQFGDIDGTQATRGNLLEFVNPLLKSHHYGSIVEFYKTMVVEYSAQTRVDFTKGEIIEFLTGDTIKFMDGTTVEFTKGDTFEFANDETVEFTMGATIEYKNSRLVYKIINGSLKRDSVKFTQSLDNLLSSEYFTDDSEVATYAQVVSTFDEGEDGNKRKVDYIQEVNPQEEKTGIDRAEIVIESNLATNYKDANGDDKETTPDSLIYKGWQTQEGKNALAEHITIEEINGEIDLANSKYVFDDDFFIGDKVRVQDEYFNFFVDVRITKYTFKQDANGYGEEAEYGGTE